MEWSLEILNLSSVQAVGNAYTLLFTADYAQVKLFPEGERAVVCDHQQ